jgi:lysyl-tRNA synthetase class 1
MSIDPSLLNRLNTWPYREARNLKKTSKRDGPVLFQTGYGPSGLPHIGTFAEVARTTWVRKAFEMMTGQKTKLIAFSDNVDGLRQIPLNVPNKEMLVEHLGKPLCDIPDPFGESESFSAHMNGKLQEFLDRFGFDYEFRSSHSQYRDGTFNEGLRQVMDNYRKVRNVVVPTLSEAKGKDWSPFMPICPSCGKVNTTVVTEVHPDTYEVTFSCNKGHVSRVEKDGVVTYKGCEPCGYTGTTSIENGNVKVGWKVDWALRWFTFGVDYEMYGKDLIESAQLSGKICRAIGGNPPQGMFYELFLDKDGAKISKSKGNGLTMEQWLEYGNLESLCTFLMKSPGKASKLYPAVVSQHIVEYLRHRKSFSDQKEAKQMCSPLWFIHQDEISNGNAPSMCSSVDYSMILNLVSVLGAEEPDVVWEYILEYDPKAQDDEAVLRPLIGSALMYHQDFLVHEKVYERPQGDMLEAVNQFVSWLESYSGDDAVEIQNAAYKVTNDLGVNQKMFFQSMYKLLVGRPQGPRLGTFVKLFGIQSSIDLAKKNLATL